MKDPLDELFQRAPLREAPAWFEVKVMARLRSEKEEKFNFFAIFQHRLAWSGVFAILIAALTLIYFTTHETESLEQHQKIMAALDAFESYEEDQPVWESDLL